MRAFDYFAPGSTEEACALLGQYAPGARILAGGTDLLIELRRSSVRAFTPIIDICRIEDLCKIKEDGEILSIGPLTTHSEIVRSAKIRKSATLLSRAASTVGSPQIRNLGTIGGNIMNAAACADTVPPLIALGASVKLRSVKQWREVLLQDFFVRPYQTKAGPDELLTEIIVPKLPANARSAFVKLGRRNALSIARLSVAAVLGFDSAGRITEARIVPGAALPVWQRILPAEQLLVGNKPSDGLFRAAGKKVAEVMIQQTGRRWSTEYKEPVIAVLVRRALDQCISPDTTTDRTAMSGDTKPERRPQIFPASSANRLSTIRVTINGKIRIVTVPANRTLLRMLREDLGFTGTKCGCEIGECGACTVLLDGEPVNACLVLAPQVHGRKVETVEGLMMDGQLHPLQESFMDHDAAHCGFCTPGMLMSAKSFIDKHSRADRNEIRSAISGNLCRCTGYIQIVDAIGDVINKETVR